MALPFVARALVLAVLGDRFPENHLLSHDLIEGALVGGIRVERVAVAAVAAAAIASPKSRCSAGLTARRP